MNFTYCVGRPNLPNWSKFQERVEEIHSSGILTNNGPMVQALETEVCKQLGVDHCIAVSNATLGLYLALSIMGFPQGAEVIVPSFTFIATIHAIRQAGLTPHFVDVENDAGRMQRNIQHLINGRTRAILVPNLFGLAADPETFESIAEYRKLKLIFDSSHGLGTTFRGVPLGSFGDCEVFSLHATKLINGFEGGLITTNSQKIAQKLTMIRNFGFHPGGGHQGLVAMFGTNAKMSEIHAAMALTNLECKDELIAHNKLIHQAYETLLPQIDFKLVSKPPSFISSNYSYVTTTCSKKIRDKVINYLIEQGTFARVYFNPTHLTHPYLTLGDKSYLSRTESLSSRIMCLPTGLSISVRDVEIITEQIKRGL